MIKITTIDLVIYCIMSLLLASFLLLAASKAFAAMQQLGYSNQNFNKWRKKKSNMLNLRVGMLAHLILLSFVVLNFSFSFLGVNTAAYIGFFANFLFFALFIYADRKYLLKIAFKNTKRAVRLKLMFFLLWFVFSFVSFVALSLIAKSIDNKIISLIRFSPISLFALLLVPILLLSNKINSIFENKINNKYVKLATQKVAKSSIKVIAITGSFGKTSVKNILTTMLNGRFKVLAAKGSHNTPLGVALTINGAMLDDYDYLILEMGAKNVGDIATLCRIAPPDIAIISGICPQHIETFGSLQNILQTKYEIIENLKPNGQKVAVFAASAKELYNRYNGVKYLQGEFISCGDVVVSKSGTTFTLIGQNINQKVSTKLLGAHNANNIALAACAALACGLTIEEIAKRSSYIEFEKHRLELIVSPNNINILDDSYNANILGACAALEVLKEFSGTKAVVTPGIVELGVMQEDENYKLGQALGKVSNLVILVGQTQTQSIMQGLMDAGFNKNQVFIVPTLNDASQILALQLRAGDTVLFLNDLPDIYN